MDGRLRLRAFWRSFGTLPLRVGLRSTQVGQLLETRILLVVLASRTCRSFIKSCFDVPLGVCFASEAEPAAVVHAIEHIWSFSQRWLWLESNSPYLVALLCSRSCRVPWRWRLFGRSLGHLPHMDFIVTDTYQEDNWVANCLVSRTPSIVALA